MFKHEKVYCAAIALITKLRAHFPPLEDLQKHGPYYYGNVRDVQEIILPLIDKLEKEINK